MDSLHTAWTVKFVHGERPQGNGPGAVPPNSGAVPPPFYITAIILFVLLLPMYIGPRGRSPSTLLLYWAPGLFPLRFILLLSYSITCFYIGPRGRSPSILLLYRAPGPFPLLSGAVPPLFCTAAVVLCFLLDMAINVGSQDSLTITCPRTVFPTG